MGFVGFAHGTRKPACAVTQNDSMLGFIEAVSAWCEAMHGAVGLDQALAELAAATGAAASALVRTRVADGYQSRIAVYDIGTGSKGVVPLRLSYSYQIFGDYLNRARVASVWTQSNCHSTNDHTLSDFQTLRGLKDFCVLVLTGGAVTQDLLELHFSDRISPEIEMLLGSLALVYARNWAGRDIGLASKSTGHNLRLTIDDPM